MQTVNVLFNYLTGNAEKNAKSLTGFVKKHKVALLAVAAAYISCVKAAMSFETQMANVSTMLNDINMKIMPEFARGIKLLQIKYGESSASLSKGLYDILSASIDASEAMEVLEVSAIAATAGLTDTGIAADAITTILNAYKMEAQDASKVSGILFATVKAGKTTFAEIASNIGNVAATANMAGVSFESLTAFIATLTRAGIKVEEAVTATNQAILSFVKEATPQAIETAKKYDLSLTSNTLRTEGLMGALNKLKNATADEMAAIFGNIRALKGFAAALGDTDGYARDLEQALNSLGMDLEAFGKMSDTTGFQVSRLWQSIKVLAIELGDPLLTPLAIVTEYFADLAQSSYEVVNNLEGMSKIISELSTAELANIIKMAESVGMTLEQWLELTEALKRASEKYPIIEPKAEITPTIGRAGMPAMGLPGMPAMGLPFEIDWREFTKIKQEILKIQTIETVKDAVNQFEVIFDEISEDIRMETEEIIPEVEAFRFALTGGINDAFQEIIFGTHDFTGALIMIFRSLFNEIIRQASISLTDLIMPFIPFGQIFSGLGNLIGLGGTTGKVSITSGDRTFESISFGQRLANPYDTEAYSIVAAGFENFYSNR